MSANTLSWSPMLPTLLLLASEDHSLYTFDLRHLADAGVQGARRATMRRWASASRGELSQLSASFSPVKDHCCLRLILPAPLCPFLSLPVPCPPLSSSNPSPAPCAHAPPSPSPPPTAPSITHTLPPSISAALTRTSSSPALMTATCASGRLMPPRASASSPHTIEYRATLKERWKVDKEVGQVVRCIFLALGVLGILFLRVWTLFAAASPLLPMRTYAYHRSISSHAHTFPAPSFTPVPVHPHLRSFVSSSIPPSLPRSLLLLLLLLLTIPTPLSLLPCTHPPPSHHVPRAVLSLKRTMLDAQRVKEECCQKHTRAGAEKAKAERKKLVVVEQYVVYGKKNSSKWVLGLSTPYDALQRCLFLSSSFLSLFHSYIVPSPPHACYSGILADPAIRALCLLRAARAGLRSLRDVVAPRMCPLSSPASLKVLGDGWEVPRRRGRVALSAPCLIFRHVYMYSTLRRLGVGPGTFSPPTHARTRTMHRSAAASSGMWGARP
ncbi:hypothetical protein C8J57DRAFT_1535780 [Mycena rebaudengoi]|nr:hypothetical protein C8J57DRAFT_1535780 [Mycena rebaudengoi]